MMPSTSASRIKRPATIASSRFCTHPTLVCSGSGTTTSILSASSASIVCSRISAASLLEKNPRLAGTKPRRSGRSIAIVMSFPSLALAVDVLIARTNTLSLRTEL
jgi:hypothetical protein